MHFDATMKRSPAISPSKPRLLGLLGPGLITGASDDDPSGIGTYSQAGAQFGFALSWTLLFSYPLMVVIQEISGRIGRTTGRGIAGNLRKHYPGWLSLPIVLVLFVANSINIGADLGAMGDATGLLLGGPRLLYIVLFGLLCAGLQIVMQYSRYISVLKWLTISLFAYFGTVIVVHVPWADVAHGLFVPSPSSDVNFWTTVVAILGTTISPYLFFWQASQEVEDIKAVPEREPLVREPRQGPSALQRIRVDTSIGMAFSNLVALAIMTTTGATLHTAGITSIETSGQAAEALRPLAGDFAIAVFTLGIVGTGLLSVPVLAGSAAYALGEARGWTTGLARRPKEAVAFYTTIAIATVIGLSLNFLPINPIQALFWSAVVNGVVAVPIMGTMMVITTSRAIMGEFRLSKPLQIGGWLATAVMAIATAGMLAAQFY